MSTGDNASAAASGGDLGALGLPIMTETDSSSREIPMAKNLLPLLREQIAILSGGRDKRGGPLLTFPAGTNLERIDHHQLVQLVLYLTSIPNEEVIQHGFTVIIDIRKSTWHQAKCALKVLQECVGDSIHMVYIIKPEKFWQKHKTSMGSSKQKFETSMISAEGLLKVVDSSQLTPDLDGTLIYDHGEWIQIRLALEEFFNLAGNLMQHEDHLQMEMTRIEYPSSIDEARRAIEEHMVAKKEISRLPLEQIQDEGQQMLSRICGNPSTVDSGYSSRGGSIASTSSAIMNADFQNAGPHILHMLDSIGGSRQRLLKLWQKKSSTLEQCLQLRLYEQDTKKMFEWLDHQRDLFLMNHTNLGNTHQIALELQEEHNQFVTQSMSMYVHIHRILDVANRLLKSGHFASEDIDQLSHQLEREWQGFALALDERSNLLAMSVVFHENSEMYLARVYEWEDQCIKMGASENPEQITELQTKLHQQHKLKEDFTACYAQVCADGKTLLAALQQPVSPESFNSVIAHTDYSASAGHILDLIHEMLQRHRNLEDLWRQNWQVSSHGMQLCMFQQDARKVLQWLEKHGEEFLNKHTGVGKSLHKAKALQQKHEEFVSIAQNTITNARRLLKDAEELTESGQCDVEEITNVARQLEARVGTFIFRVERRRQLLELSVSFHTNAKELSTWFKELEEELNIGTGLAGSVEEAENEVSKFDHQREITLDASVNTVSEGQSIIDQLEQLSMENKHLNYSDACHHIEGILQSLEEGRRKLEGLWASRRMRLELSLQLKQFEREALEEIANILEEDTRQKAEDEAKQSILAEELEQEWRPQKCEKASQTRAVKEESKKKVYRRSAGVQVYIKTKTKETQTEGSWHGKIKMVTSTGSQCSLLQPQPEYVPVPPPPSENDSDSDSKSSDKSKEYVPYEEDTPSTDDDFQSESEGLSEPWEEDKFVVFKSCLLTLFSVCLQCTGVSSAAIKTTVGTLISVVQKCKTCGWKRTWNSQPYIKGVPAGNLFLSSSILFAGASATKVLRVLKFYRCQAISERTFFRQQKLFLQPAIIKTWEAAQHSLIRELMDEDRPLILGGDARADSPGHTAKFGSYSLMELKKQKVLEVILVQKNEVSSSNAMELEGLKRAMRWMIDTGMLSGLAIECIITDRHLQVSKWIRENLTILGITHFYDVWHIAKSIKKKLKALGKQKGCGAVMDWTQSIINHLYWCASSTPTGDPQMMLEKFLSIENHIQNKHSGHPGELFVECAHEPIPAEAERTKAWLEPGTEPCEKLSAVLNQTHLKNDVKKMSPKEQTSSIEAFHSLILHFAPKQLVFSYEGMTCRTLLAALHYNENSGRCQARSSEGKTAFKLDFPRAKCGGYTLRKRLVKATFGYVDDLLSEVHRLLERGDQTQLDPESRISSPPPTLSSSHEGPTLEDAIRKHYTRFSSL